MTKKKMPQTIEGCNAEMERTQKQIRQYENRNKMLGRKLAMRSARQEIADMMWAAVFRFLERGYRVC